MTERPTRVPVSTYRLQLHPGFGFPQAREIVPYLSALGITECYVSPIFAARPGSMHGYDICDQNRLNPELGTREEFEAFCHELQQHSMGLIVDFVPNHMAIDPQANLKWRSVLENGPSSQFAAFFDIDWDPVKPELKNKVLLPILDDQYGNALEAGQLQLQFENGSFSLQYAGHNLPLNPRQTRVLLSHRLDQLRAQLSEDDPGLRELLSIAFQLEHIPPSTETTPQRVEEREREKSVASDRLAALVGRAPDIGRFIEQNLREFNGTAGEPASFDFLHQLLDQQPYRLSYWKTAVHEINYRRFFDINDLAGIRMEDPAVFEATHVLIGDLIRQGLVTGLRLDHVDGLFDPKQYFEQLQRRCASGEQPLFVVVEKILSAGEALRRDWAVHGTTGYEFLNEVAGLFVDPAGGAELQKTYLRFTGNEERFAGLVYESKKLIVTTSMASELNVLAHELNRISESNRRYRDFTLDSLTDGLREVVACFPVYRSYFTAEGYDAFDERAVETATSAALRKSPAQEPSMFAFIRRMLLPRIEPGLPEAGFRRRVRFAMKFQQYTGPVQAKGVEDTAFYRYGPLLSLNEVGGEPARFGRSVAEFHESNRRRLEQWPLSMLCTATHDTKRGEDARCRISVLSEIPREYRSELSRWARVNAGLKTAVYGDPAPSRANEYFYYQALLGAWPAEAEEQAPPEFMERMQQYMLKATKEEKIHTSWIHPSAQYDDAVRAFVGHTLSGPHARRFLRYFLPFQRRVAMAGVVNSLAQLVLKTVSPGVPDFYQGTELWDLSLVDPDNRRAVDFAGRKAMLGQIRLPAEGESCSEECKRGLASMLEHWPSAEIKLSCTAAAANLRRRFSQLFLHGAYVALESQGERGANAVALARQSGTEAVIAIVPRLTAKLSPSAFPLGEAFWKQTSVALAESFRSRRYRNVFTGETLSVETALELAKVCEWFPVALLVGE
ncbi:MAG TPA: malto-oligosyltrehalose synthase [Terriglobales bacterium]|nr:malto-oligosyltrehalose synthase [Terriglobales bacterium]